MLGPRPSRRLHPTLPCKRGRVGWGYGRDARGPRGAKLLCTKPERGPIFHLKVRVIQPHERYGYPPMPYGPASSAPVVMLALLLAGEVANAGGPEPVEFPEEDITLTAVVYPPDGPGPFPAV